VAPEREVVNELSVSGEAGPGGGERLP
jgi:hypothetical protein